ncbi:hypothetical protein RJ639_043945 [Escallonia herrerae]|uniref:RNase H type-1 domain-containing protein n=1 Tax=Escallonia herrerae TaxID=1293975 RepID=A0AA89B4K5_9ASTE|nr:hypothetical protein RJ639_043945 [Escallonia herrerae]
MDTPLYGFSNHPVAAEGIIALPVAIGTPPAQANFMLDFVVVKMKFPTEHGIGEVKGDQTTARQCYVTSCRSKNKEALIIEDLQEDTKMQRGEPCTLPKDPPQLVIYEAPDPWNLYVDGSSALSSSGAGLILISPEGFTIKYALRFGFQASNNEAEYEALLAAIRLAHALKVDSLSVHSDSQLVVNHVLGDYKARDERMAQYLNLVKTLAVKFQHFIIRQIPRDQNTQADTLSRLASAEKTDVRRSVCLEFLKDRSISSQTKIEIIEREPCWMDMIIKYLSIGELPSERHEARNLRVKAARYALVEGTLYKKSFNLPYLKCLRPPESSYALFTSVAHPQSNGQTENMNQSVLQGLKKKLDEAKGAWVDKLPKPSYSLSGKNALGDVKDQAEDKANPKPWYTTDKKSGKMSTEDLQELIWEYPLPEGWYAHLPGLQEPANYGTKFETGIYEEEVKSGYRLRLHPFALRFFEHYHMAPGQLVPNGWRKLVGLIYLDFENLTKHILSHIKLRDGLSIDELLSEEQLEWVKIISPKPIPAGLLLPPPPPAILSVSSAETVPLDSQVLEQDLLHGILPRDKEVAAEEAHQKREAIKEAQEAIHCAEELSKQEADHLAQILTLEKRLEQAKMRVAEEKRTEDGLEIYELGFTNAKEMFAKRFPDIPLDDFILPAVISPSGETVPPSEVGDAATSHPPREGPSGDAPEP